MNNDPTEDLTPLEGNLSFIEAVQRIAELERQRRDLESQLREVKRRMLPLTEAVVEMMDANALARIRVKGMTISPKSNRYVVVESQDLLREALANSPGWDYLLKPTVNSNSLRSAILEVIDAGSELPSQLSSVITIEERRALSFTESQQEG